MGIALALAVSFPVRALSRFMPRGWAIPVRLLTLVRVAIIALVPILMTELTSFIANMPGYVATADQSIRELLEPLAELGPLPATPEEFVANLGQYRLHLAPNVAQQILGGLLGFVSGTFNLALTLFEVLYFVAV